jgi:hypothetical protein
MLQKELALIFQGSVEDLVLGKMGSINIIPIYSMNLLGINSPSHPL